MLFRSLQSPYIALCLCTPSRPGPVPCDTRDSQRLQEDWMVPGSSPEELRVELWEWSSPGTAPSPGEKCSKARIEPQGPGRFASKEESEQNEAGEGQAISRVPPLAEQWWTVSHYLQFSLETLRIGFLFFLFIIKICIEWMSESYPEWLVLMTVKSG